MSNSTILLLHGDCKQHLSSFPDSYFGAIITDPPESTHGGWSAIAWMREHNLWRLLREDGIAIIMTRHPDGYVRIPKRDVMQSWTEQDAALAPYETPLYRYVRPVDAVVKLVEQTQGIILDPYAGSGSTLLAARQCGRSAVGIEVNRTRLACVLSALST